MDCLITWILHFTDYVQNRLWFPKMFVGISALRFPDYINGNPILDDLWKYKLGCFLTNLNMSNKARLSNFIAYARWLLK